ncbi:MAG: AMIN domain-containing protein, partial [Candidatus Binatia bacterium]
MSGWRAWGGYGVALGLTFVAACVQRPVKPPPAQEIEAAEASSVETFAAPAPAAETPEESTLRLKGITLVEDEGQTGIFIKVSRAPDKIEHFTLAKPNRLVIDLHGPIAAEAVPMERNAVGDEFVSRVRVGRQNGRLRITVDLKGTTPKYEVNDLKTMVVAFLGQRSGAPAPAKSQVLYAEAEPAPRVTTTTETVTAPVVEMADVEPPTPETRIVEGPAAAPRGYTGQKISLDFKDADILNVLRILAEVGGENIIATDDVKGRVTVRLVDVPWDQALD